MSNPSFWDRWRVRQALASRLLHRARIYVRYELREIVWPSSLPDPPEAVARAKRQRLTWKEHMEVWRDGLSAYADTWRSPDPSALEEEERKQAQAPEDPMVQDLRRIGRVGSGTLLPWLQQQYLLRVAAYSDALKQFLEGYREGFHSSADFMNEGQAAGAESSTAKTTRSTVSKGGRREEGERDAGVPYPGEETGKGVDLKH